MNTDAFSETDIAIVGMSGRFPGANDVDELWRRIAAGEDCLTDVSVDEAITRGARPTDVADEQYVRRTGMLADVAGFDHGFFGIGSRDADVMDPQHRHFLECAWSALEMSNTVPERFDGAIGVFGGCGMNTYLVNNLLTAPGLLDRLGWFLLRHTGNDKDFLVNNVAYRLDLRGPAVNVQTACSTSLVAVHLAVQSLLGFECDLALAGGATIEVPHGVGYRYHEGEILSPDGQCRAFDAASAGTVLTSGVGIVALRRLSDALADGDAVLAVIKATAINNDGARKVGFLAPSVDGHADVVREALAVADLAPDDLQLVEAHGTGTAVGDPIEIAALTEAFRSFGNSSSTCRITSTKPNIGHLDTAAGTASLIKVVQALRNRTLPPMANHTAPNPLIDWERSPFVVEGGATEWPGDRPRRAGISSLGVGGTNAHVIVQEAPERAPSPPSPVEQVLVLSAESTASLASASERLADHIERHPDVELADVAHTLITGRRQMRHRRAVTVADAAAAGAALRAPDRHRSAAAVIGDQPVRLGFMFPGGGSHYRGMGAGLDDRFRVFHDVRALGARLAVELGGVDVARAFEFGPDDDEYRLPTRSLPAVFITSVALARQWMTFGAAPDLLLGHSLGEYVAAHLAGVLDFEDALSLVVVRSQLMERVGGPDTAMLVVPLDEQRVTELLPPSLSLATINAADECVVAGRARDIASFATHLAEHDVTPIRIPLAAAAHSALLDPVLDEFRAATRSVTFAPPTVPYLSNLTGTWIESEQAMNPDYWVDHLRGTVRFHDAVRLVCSEGPTMLTELGPGHSLSTAARRTTPAPVGVAPALRHPDHEIDDTAFTLQAFARSWVFGANVDLRSLPGSGRSKTVLPTYEFDHTSHWIGPGDSRAVTPPEVRAMQPVPAHPIRRLESIDEFTWIPDWAEAPSRRSPVDARGEWIVSGAADDAMVDELVVELVARGLPVRRSGPHEPLDVAGPTTFVLVVPPGDGALGPGELAHDVVARARILGSAPFDTQLLAVTREAFAAHGHATNPADAVVAGVVRVADHEYDGLTGRVVDVDRDVPVGAIADELLVHGPSVVAIRGGCVLMPSRRTTTPPVPSAESAIHAGGTYVVTGAFGGVGFAIAEHLARDHQAHLVLVSRSPVPSGPAGDRWLAAHGYDDPSSRRIRRLRALERHGTKVEVIVADTSDVSSLAAAVAAASRRFGGLDGAVHAAGVLDDQLVALADKVRIAGVIEPKVNGAIALAETLPSCGARLLVLISSTSTIVAPPGQAAYVGANTVLDQMAGQFGDLRIVTIDYGLWAVDGMATNSARRQRLGFDSPRPFEHPILDTVSNEGDGRVVLAGRITPDHHWVLDEHRLADGTPILPGTGHLDLMITAARAAGVHDPALVDVMLLEPLIADVDPVTVRVVVSADRATIQVERDDEGRWTMVSTGSLGTGRTGASGSVHGPMPIEGDDPFEAQRATLTLGARWGAITTARRGDGIAQVEIRLDDPVGSASAWSLHPSIADMCTAAAVMLAPPLSDGSLWVPVRYQQVSADSPLPTVVTATAVLRSAPHDDADDGCVSDIEGVDEHGRVVLTMSGVELRDIAIGSLAPTTTIGPLTPSEVRPGSLAEIALDLGLDASEGVELFERILATTHDRVIASSLHLDDIERVGRDERPKRGEETSEPAEGSLPTTVEGVITRIWVDLLGVADVGPDDDFFDLGGHSLLAIRLMGRLQRELGVRLSLSDLLGSSTVAALAERVCAVDPSTTTRIASGQGELARTSDPGRQAPSPVVGTRRHLVTLSQAGARRPFYVVHGAGGNLLFLWSLARAMSGDRPLHGFQAHGVDGSDLPDRSIEEMAARYVTELRAHDPGPYLLGGFSGGGLVTLEMARQLREQGEQVDLVVLFDSAPPGKVKPNRVNRARYMVGHVARGEFRPVVIHLLRGARVRLERLVPRSRTRVADTERESVALGYQNIESHGYVNLYYYFSAAADRYVVGEYDVDVLLVKADRAWPTQPPDYHWAPHITGELTVVTSPGDHHTMFFPENATRLAVEITPVLARYDTS